MLAGSVGMMVGEPPPIEPSRTAPPPAGPSSGEAALAELPLFEPSVIDPAASGARYRSIPAVIEAMEDDLARYEDADDHRAVFAGVYLMTTVALPRFFSEAFFDDDEWVERVVIAFAGYYFDAVRAHERGEPCPPAWQLALDVAASGDATVLEDALLGMNAHINSDLPVVLAQILEADGVWPDARALLRRRRDHDRINDVLRLAIDDVQDRLSNHYARFTGILDNVLGRRDECLSARVISHYRTDVWHQAELMLGADGPDGLVAERRRIEADALKIGQELRGLWSFRLVRPLTGVTRRLRLL